MPPRVIAQMALLQTALVVCGFVGLGAVLKLNAYPEDFGGMVRWNRLAVFLRHHGLWLMLAPTFWVLLATYVQQLERGWRTSRVAFGLGLLLAALILAGFFYAAIFPFTWAHFYMMR
jgi:hypothetical protein